MSARQTPDSQVTESPRRAAQPAPAYVSAGARLQPLRVLATSTERGEPDTPQSLNDTESPTSSTAPTVIVPQGRGDAVSPDWGRSPSSAPHGPDSPVTRRLSAHLASSAAGPVVTERPETVVLYTLVPEAEVKRTVLVTPPSPSSGLGMQRPQSSSPREPESLATPASVASPPPPPPPPRPLEDEVAASPPALIHREGSLYERVRDARARLAALRAIDEQTLDSADSEARTDVKRRIIASLPLDADKSTYESLCAVGTAPLFLHPSPAQTAATVTATQPRLRSAKRPRSPSATPPSSSSSSLPQHTGATCWLTEEQHAEVVAHGGVTASDEDARLDLLEAVELAQLSLFIPRTFPLYRLVAQLVPSAVWIREHELNATNTTNTTNTSDTSPSPPLSVADVQSFVHTLRRTHREHVLQCLYDDSNSDGAQAAVATDDTHGHEPPLPPHSKRSPARAEPVKSEDDHTTPLNAMRVKSEGRDEAADTEPPTFFSSLAQAEAYVMRTRRARRRAQVASWYALTRHGRGCLVQWQDGTVGYTPDLDRLFEEEHTRQTRTYHPLPAPGIHTAVTAQDTAQAGAHDAEARVPASPRHPPTTLRDAALTQLHRFDAFEAERSTFVHAQCQYMLPPRAKADSDADVRDARVSPGAGGQPVTTTATSARRACAERCACPLCVDWRPQFAQVQPPPAGLEIYLDHLHAASTIDAGLATKATRSHRCVPLTQRRHSYEAFETTSSPPLPPAGLSRDFQFTSSYMLSYEVDPCAVFPALATTADEGTPARTAAHRRHKTPGKAKGGWASPTSAQPPSVLLWPASPASVSSGTTPSPCAYAWLDDAVLEEVVLVGVAPRGQPYALELVAPSVAFRRFLLADVVAHVQLYSDAVLPLVDTHLLSSATGEGPLTPAGDAVRHTASAYRLALSRALEALLTQPNVVPAAHGNGDVAWLHAEVWPLLLQCPNAGDDDGGPACGPSPPSPELDSPLCRLAAQHAAALVASAADAVVSVVLEALRTVAYRRTFTMYEMLRLLSSKSLFVANRPLLARYRDWYTQVPSPASILRLLQRSSRFGAALHRAFSGLAQEDAPGLPDSWTRARHTHDQRRKKHEEEDEEEVKEEALESDDQSGTRTRCATASPRRSHHHDRFPLGFVPEAALLEPRYLLRFTLWVLETHHSQLPQAQQMADALVAQVAQLSDAHTEADHHPPHHANTHHAPHSLFPIPRSQKLSSTVAEAEGEGGLPRAYASITYPFLVPHCPASVDPALSHVLMAVGLRGRTFLPEEMDKYVNTLISRGER